MPFGRKDPRTLTKLDKRIKRNAERLLKVKMTREQFDALADIFADYFDSMVD